MSGHWSLRVLIGLPILIIVLAALIVFGIVVWRRLRNDPVDRLFGRGVGITCWVIALALVILAASPLGYWPYVGEYHRWEPVTGDVERIEKRLVSGGSSMEEKYVVIFEGNRQEYRVDDTRAALVEAGDELTVSCKRQWQWAATHGYECRWIGVNS